MKRAKRLTSKKCIYFKVSNSTGKFGYTFKNYLLLIVYNSSLVLHINIRLIKLLNEQLVLLQLLQS
jgi:hypothetical protein